MLTSLTRSIFLAGLTVASLALVAWALTAGPLRMAADSLRPQGGGGTVADPRPRPAVPDPTQPVIPAVHAGWHAARPALAVTAILALALTVARGLARRRRILRRL